MNWAAVERLFTAILDAPAADRSELLASATDPEVRTEVERLLRHHDTLATEDPDFLANLDLETAARLVESDGDDPKQVGRFEILERLGTGSSGTVYRARDPDLDRVVALKLLAADTEVDASTVTRFEAEARLASALDHPHIVTIHEIGRSSDGRPFIAMGLLGGGTLRARIAAGALPLGEALKVAAEVADGLAAAHAKGIIHRDVKPENILLSGNGACLVDFGIAGIGSATKGWHRLGVGTAPYMSPEQVDSGSVDHRTDIWSLGVVLYEMLAGRRPFAGRDTENLFQAIRNDEPVALDVLRPGLPGSVVAVVGTCLAKEPDRRTYSAARIRDILLDASRVGTARRTGWKRGLVAAAALLIVAAGLIWPDRPAPESPTDSDLPEPAVAVLPWRVGVTEGQELQEGMVELLSYGIEGTAGLRKIDPTTVITAWRSAGDSANELISAERAAAIGRQVGARYVVTGSITGYGPGIAMIAEVYEVDPWHRRGSARVAGPLDSVSQLVDQLTLDLLRNNLLPSDNNVAPASLGALTTRSLPALKEYLAGERSYRVAKWREAALHYAKAVELDSNFARARYRLIKSDDWGAKLGDVDTHLQHLARLVDRLPDRDRLLVLGDMGSRLPYPRTLGSLEQIELLHQLLRRYPDDVEGWVALGDRAFHDRETLLPAQVWREAFRRAIELNHHYSEPYLHLIEDAIFHFDSAGADRLLTEFHAIDRGSSRCTQRVVFDLLWGTATSRRQALALLDSLPYEVIVDHCLPGTVAIPATPDLRDELARLHQRIRDTLGHRSPESNPFTHLRLRVTVPQGVVAPIQRDLASLEGLTTDQGLWSERRQVQLHLSGFPDSAAAHRAADRLSRVQQFSSRFWVGLLAIEERRWRDLDSTVAWMAAQEQSFASRDEQQSARIVRVYRHALGTYRDFVAGSAPTTAMDSAVMRLPWLSSIDPVLTLRYLVGLRHLERGNLRDAERYFQSFGPIDLLATRAAYYLGVIAERTDRPDEALAHYRLFIHWWQSADPDQRQQLRDAEAAVARLESRQTASR